MAFGTSCISNATNAIVLGANSTSNSIANSVVLGANASPLSTSSSFALAINSASVVAGSLGVTVNGGAYQIPMVSALFATTAGAGPTTLTATSSQYQVFTTAQTVTLPVASTLQPGFWFAIINDSVGNLVVQSSGANTKVTLTTMTWSILLCVLASGTTAASWLSLGGGAVL